MQEEEPKLSLPRTGSSCVSLQQQHRQDLEQRLLEPELLLPSLVQLTLRVLPLLVSCRLCSHQTLLNVVL
jgi:hypothetical protein